MSALTLALTYVILALLLGIVFLAHPAFRSKQHNKFEMTHRFLGWSATALVWAQFVSLTNDYREDTTLGKALLHDPHFWLICLLTSMFPIPHAQSPIFNFRSDSLDYFTLVATSQGSCPE